MLGSLVPEFTKDQEFKLTWTQLLDEVDEALALGHKVKPVLLGPVTYLWLGKEKGEEFGRLSLLNKVLPVYKHDQRTCIRYSMIKDLELYIWHCLLDAGLCFSTSMKKLDFHEEVK
jgi:hypothetical protein